MARKLKVTAIKRKNPEDYVDLFVLAVIAFARQLEEEQSETDAKEKEDR